MATSGCASVLTFPPPDPARPTSEGERDEHGLRQGWYRFFTSTGELVATAHYRDDLLHGQVITFSGNHRVAELSYKDGLPDGAFRKRVPSGVYEDAAVRWEEGFYAQGVPTGVLRLRAEDGTLIATRNFGEGPIEDETLRSCLRAGGLSCPADWSHRACALIAKKRVAEALCAIARAVGAGADPEELRAALLRVAAPVTVEEAERRADAVRSTGSARVLLGALLRGAEPTRVLRRLALLARGDASAAFFHASIALREWPLSPIVSSALRALRDGEAKIALEEARRLLLSHEADAHVLRVLAVRRGKPKHDGPLDAADDLPTMQRRLSAVSACELVT